MFRVSGLGLGFRVVLLGVVSGALHMVPYLEKGSEVWAL